MITCSEINKAIRAGKLVFATVTGIDGDRIVKQARVGYPCQLQVQVEVAGQLAWLAIYANSITVEEEVAK